MNPKIKKKAVLKSKNKTALFISDVNPDYLGEQKLYKLSTPLGGVKFVVVSAVIAPFSGPETYIFKSNSRGEISEWGELDGSYHGGLSHETALANAGYRVVEVA